MRLPMAARDEQNSFRVAKTGTPRLTPLPVWLSSGSVKVQVQFRFNSVAPHVIPFSRLQGRRTSAHVRRLKPAQCRRVLASSVDSDRQYGSATKGLCATRFPHLRSNTYYYGPSMSSQGSRTRAFTRFGTGDLQSSADMGMQLHIPVLKYSS